MTIKSVSLRAARLLIICLVLLAPTLVNLANPYTVHADEEAKGTSIYIPSIVSGRAGPASPAPDWLVYLNSYRAMAYLPELYENTTWSSGGMAHSRYTVKNDTLMHTEDTGNQWYTADGKAAAEAGNLMASYDSSSSDRHAIDSWMQAPFHSVGILDPALEQVGFGSYRETDGGLQMGATLDIMRGLGGLSPNIVFPVIWPANGATVPLSKYWGESPDPLTSCPGYAAPAGLPIVIQLGPGDVTPVVSSYSFSQGGTALESCVFSETTYSNPESVYQDLGRAILNERDAVIMIPRAPLTPGASYTVSITANSRTFTWTFSVASTTVD
jgi:hypothetical protein